ncbi:MAG: DUF3352 domain-containing protein [Tepidisphaeraceae bacterium]
MHRLALALFIVCFLATSASAQPLADRIPADAIVYVGWKGTSSLGPEYDGSHTKGVVDASALPQLFNQFLPDLIRNVRTKDRDAAEALDAISAIGGPLWRHPSALYFGGIDMSDAQKPKPRFALLCDAGEESPQLLARLKGLIDQATDVPFALSATTQGNLVVFSTFDLPAKPDSTLAANKEFTDALAQVQKDAMATTYIDGEGLLQLVDMLVNAGGDAEAIRNWPKARAVSGLEGLKRIAWTCGFDGADWGSRGFIEAPAPRKGILSLLDSKPLSDDFLKTIPKSATLVAAGGFDLSRLLAEVRAAVKGIDAKAAQDLEKGLSAGSMMLGANVEKDLIDPLGSQWAMYCAPTVGGNGLLGLTLVNRLDDPAKAERTLGQLEVLTNNLIAMQMRKQKDAPRIAFRQTKTAEMTVHFLAVPFVAPAWGVRGENVYAGLFPQVVTTAAAQGENGKDSILDNEAFTKARARVGGEQASGVQFLDLEKVGADGYAGVLAMMQLGVGMADMLGVPAPPMVLPPLDKLQPHFAPVAVVARSDERGFYYRKVSPFPGAENFGAQNQALFGYNAMAMSVLMPSLNRARETANRVKCASNMRQIGLAILLFSNENRGKYPATLGELLKTQEITVDVFTCPSTSLTVPANLRAGGVEARAAWVDEHASYAYAGAGKTNAAGAGEIVLYEHLHNHGNDGINILFGDGRVEFVSRIGALKMLKEQNLDAGEGSGGQ